MLQKYILSGRSEVDIEIFQIAGYMIQGKRKDTHCDQIYIHTTNLTEAKSYTK